MYETSRSLHWELHTAFPSYTAENRRWWDNLKASWLDIKIREMSLFTHASWYNLHRWCRLPQLHGWRFQLVLSKMITSIWVLSWPCWEQLRAVLCSSWNFSRKYASSFRLSFYIWEISEWEFPDKSAPRPHFGYDDKGARAALLCLRLARKLFALQHANSCIWIKTPNNFL